MTASYLYALHHCLLQRSTFRPVSRVATSKPGMVECIFCAWSKAVIPAEDAALLFRGHHLESIDSEDCRLDRITWCQIRNSLVEEHADE